MCVCLSVCVCLVVFAFHLTLSPDHNPVYDYKEGDQSIYLISYPFEGTGELEPVTLQELIDFSKELEYPEDNITFLCEYELQELTSSSWLGTKLTLHF